MDMIEPTRQAHTSLLRDLLPSAHRQLELPLEGVPSLRRVQLREGIKEFATGFAPRLGSQLLMRLGVPMVAAATPLAIRMFAPEQQDDWKFNLLVGSGLGGAWGAMVGAALPFSGAGDRIPRLRAAGLGAAGGIVMAPAIAAVSKGVVDWIVGDADDAAP
jgi:hypothetical protein